MVLYGISAGQGQFLRTTGVYVITDDVIERVDCITIYWTLANASLRKFPSYSLLILSSTAAELEAEILGSIL